MSSRTTLRMVWRAASCPPPDMARRRKYLMALRREWDPHVRGVLVSGTPRRLFSCAPEHGSSKSRDAAPSVRRDQKGRCSESGAGHRSILVASAPITTQSKYWCNRSPSALKMASSRSLAFQVWLSFVSSAFRVSLVSRNTRRAAATFSASVSSRVACGEATGTRLLDRPLHTMSGSWHTLVLSYWLRHAWKSPWPANASFAGPV